MNSFKKFYVFGMNAKLYAALYFAAILFIVGIVSVCVGTFEISFLKLLEMFAISLVIGFLQEFMIGRKSAKDKFNIRTTIWVAISVVLTVVGAVVFKWFSINSFWIYTLFTVFVTGGFIAMVVGMKFEQEYETIKLNSDLKAYKESKR